MASQQEVISKMIYDCASTTADNFLKTYCGIDLSNADTGAITGLDASGSVIKTAESVVPEDSEYQEYTSNSFSVNGLTVKLGKLVNDVLYDESYYNLSDSKKYIWNSLYSYWMKSGLDLIAESYGNKFGFDSNSSAVTHTMYVTFSNNSGNLASMSGGPGWAQKCTNNLRFDISLYYYDDATGENVAVTNGEEYLDRTVAHELTHAVMRANIDYFDYLPAFIKEGMAELTHGIDDVRKNAIKKLAGDSSLLEQALVMDYDTVKISGVNSPSYAGGFMFLRYLARQAGDLTLNNSTSKTMLKTFDGNDTIASDADYVTIQSGAGNDSIKPYGDKNSIDSGAGNDFLDLYHSTTNVTINAGAGNDYIHLYKEATKQTVNGGAGNDSIRSYNTNGVLYQMAEGEGNDTINGFASKDTISVSGSTYYTKETLDGSVKVSLFGGGSITLLDASDKTISVKGSTLLNIINNTTASKKITVGSGASSINNNGAKVTILGASSVDSIWNYGATVSVNAGSGNDFVDNRGGKVTVLGGKGNDILRNDTYNARVDSVKLSGGDGNDRLNNWADKVTMSGGAGADTIENYKNDGGGSLVSISGGDKDKIVNFGTNSTLDGGAGNDTIENSKRGYINEELVHDDGGHDVTIIGGLGNDLLKNVNAENVLFSYDTGDGLDTIQGFNTTSKLEIDGGTGSYTFAKSGTDFVFTIGKGKVTVQDATNLSSVHVNRNLLFTNKTSKTITAGSKVKALNASTRTSAIKITGNTLANTIRGGSKNDSLYGDDGNDKLYGQAGNDYLSGGSGNDYLSGAAGNDKIYGGSGNDTLIGGTGNDSLWGGDGADKFIYHNDSDNGKDVIFGFDSNDTLTLDSLDFTGSYKSDVLTLNFSDGSIAFRDFDTTTFHVNSSTYKISGSKFKKQ